MSIRKEHKNKLQPIVNILKATFGLNLREATGEEELSRDIVE
jgi:hypothetical protein